ncbi:hypothetical protein OXB_1801 [Bacillus sp. OxB-1]|nr:hypothetical protein OXB_1801 [Bacillus sp. OxB-1]
MTRLFLFLISYGLVVITVSHMIFYFNYRSLGYEWNQIFQYIVRTADFALFLIAAAVLVLTITVSVRVPSRPPSSEEWPKR